VLPLLFVLAADAAVLKVRLAAHPEGLTIRVDGSPVPAGDLQREVPPGRHSVIASAPGHHPMAWSGTLAEGQEELVVVNLEPVPVVRRGPPRWLFYATTMVAAGTFLGATYFGVSALRDSQDQKSKDPYLRDPEIRDRIGTSSTIANILFAAGGALAATAVTLYIMTDWRIAPTVGGAVLTRAF
jgi:hypothetical protein